MRSALAVACVVWTMVFARGLTRRLLTFDQRDAITLTLAAAGFGLGLATLFVLWSMLIWPGGPAFAIGLSATILVWFAAALGRDSSALSSSRRHAPARAGRGLGQILLITVTAVCCAAILFNAAYWPFEIGDALALYAPFGRHLYETATLPVGDRLYEAYPMLVPTSYAITHWTAGSVNEYVARLVPALMAIGAVAAGGVLARDMDSPASGSLAAALIALTPVFGRWASSGYTDVPAAFYVGLTAIFAWRWWETGASRALVFAGVAAGLAMWTKNSTLALLPSLVCLVVTRPYARTGQVFGRWLWRDLAAVLTPIAVVAGPWYLRNQSVFGFLIPPTIWTDSARHTPGALAAMLQSDQHFGISGWVFTAGIVYGLARLSRGHRDAGRWYVLLVFLMPFAAAWWWAASYESRFLVTMLPIVGAMGALMLADAAAVSVDRLPARGLRVASLAALVILSAATLVALRKTVEHKSVLVRTLWPDDAARHRVRVGGLFGLAAALNALPEASRVGGVPAMARLYLDRRRFTTLDFAPRREPPHLLVHDYDYVVYRQRPGEPLLFEAAAPIFRTADGYLLVATSVPVQTSARPSGDRR